ncbi:MAG TPA: CBS domain-containing protein [Blastocatellia bacterium]|nr:CBS domain-containing protein [Blastocatellia bacterium]
MGYANRNFRDYGGESDYEAQRRRSSGRANRRGYGEDYRGYSRGYNMSREPNYRTEQNRGYSGWGTERDENYGRGGGESNRWRSSEEDRWETQRNFYGRGARRSHIRCRDIMTRNVTTARRDTPIFEVARLMRDEDIGSVPVIGDDGKLEGIVTDRDLVVEGLTADKPEAELRAEDCMTDDLFTANQNDRLVEVIDEMGDHQVRRVPVVDGRGRLVGIISMADIAVQTNKDDELADTLEDISKPSSVLDRIANWFNW